MAHGPMGGAGCWPSFSCAVQPCKLAWLVGEFGAWMPPTTAAAQSCQVIQANISARPSGNKATRPLSYLIRPPSTGPRDMRVPPQPGREASGCAEPQDLANHAETRPTILPAGSIAISITAARPKSVEPAAVATAWISLRSKREVGEYEIDY